MTERCALVSADLDEPLPGTALHAPAWLLIEDLGPWGPDGLTESTVEPVVAATLAKKAADAGVRVQMIRRTEHAMDAPDTRTVFVVHSGPGEPWVRKLAITDADLAMLDPAMAISPDAPEGIGEAYLDDILLVCTHGKRDACCAQFGRPIAQAVAKRLPEQTWETSHTGGHRFAAVLIALPEGHTFGRLTPGDVTSTVNALSAGRIPLAHYRGRSAVGGPAQAAEIAVRADAKVGGRRAVQAVGHHEDGGAHVVQVDADEVRWRVVVATRPLGTLRPASCGGRPEDRSSQQVVSVGPVNPTIVLARG